MAHIDTLKAFKDLIAAKVPKEQAEAQVQTLDASLDGLATKEDLKDEIHNLETRLDTKLDAKFNILDAKIDAKFNTIRTLGWALFGLLMVIFGSIAVPLSKIAFKW